MKIFLALLLVSSILFVQGQPSNHNRNRRWPNDSPIGSSVESHPKTADANTSEDEGDKSLLPLKLAIVVPHLLGAALKPKPGKIKIPEILKPSAVKLPSPATPVLPVSPNNEAKPNKLAILAAEKLPSLVGTVVEKLPDIILGALKPEPESPMKKPSQVIQKLPGLVETLLKPEVDKPKLPVVPNSPPTKPSVTLPKPAPGKVSLPSIVISPSITLPIFLPGATSSTVAPILPTNCDQMSVIDSNPIPCYRSSTGCYCVGQNPVPWLVAYETCKAGGRNLISINSLAKQIDLQSRLQQVVGTSTALAQSGWWTSGLYQEQLNSFVWASDGTPFTYTNWKPGSPSPQPQSGTCVHVESNGLTTQQWDEQLCTAVFPYICE